LLSPKIIGRNLAAQRMARPAVHGEDKIMPDDSGPPRHRLAPGPSDTARPGWPRSYAAAATAATALVGAAVWLSTLVHPSPVLHDLALFAHLGFLVLGFGAVLVADYFFALWVLGRTTFAEAVTNTTRLHPLIWSGLAGLLISGALLSPNLTSGITILKLGFVTALTVNGVQAMALSKRMSVLDGIPPMRLLLWGGCTSAVSQICWWGAVLIGFLNVNR
jgi:hypothetical protein